MDRVMLAAPKSGSGKTVVTCALLGALKNSGRQPVSFKCGPDYIDPMFHETVIGVPSRNLDTFFTGAQKTRELFLDSAGKGDIAILEGVMGLFDGLGGIRREGSSYHLAEVTGTPIVLVVDAKGMGRSLLALLAGFLGYDRKGLIRGVILNRISKGYYEIIRPLIEEELGLTVLGFLPDQAELGLESRHLGLVLPGEVRKLQESLAAASGEFAKTVSVPRIEALAATAGEVQSERSTGQEPQPGRSSFPAPVIAVARDEAFCFYYADNLRLLEEYGAELRYFSPLHEEDLPMGCGGLLLGGGYPELYAGKLSGNTRMRAAIRRAAAEGMPIVAECGGFLYLHRTLTDQEGISHEMAGVLPGACYYAGRSVRFGYIELAEQRSCFLPQGARIRGHEFHYYESTDNGHGATASKPVTGKTYPCVIANETCWMGFPHLYYPSNPSFAESFVAKAKKYMQSIGKIS